MIAPGCAVLIGGRDGSLLSIWAGANSIVDERARSGSPGLAADPPDVRFIVVGTRQGVAVSEWLDWLPILIESTDLDTCSDDVLMDRARAGEVDAFGELVRRHERAALRVAAVVSGSTAEAFDISQEGFVKAYQSTASYRGTGSVRSWLLRIVANEAKNEVRSRGRRLSRDDRHASLQLRATDGVEASVVGRAEQEELVSALATLRDEDRAVLGCRFVAELSEAETAVVLGIAAGTVKSRTSRALGRLRSQLGVDSDGS